MLVKISSEQTPFSISFGLRTLASILPLVNEDLAEFEYNNKIRSKRRKRYYPNR